MPRSARASANDADRRYFADCLQKASWLEKSLDQRARTVLKVATEIVRRQDGFLNDGVAYLKPLNLRMVADALGIHEFDGQPRSREQDDCNPARDFRVPLFLHRRNPRHVRRGGSFCRGGEASDPQDDLGGISPMPFFPTTPSSQSCRARGSKSRAAPSPSTGRSCASAPRLSGGASGGSRPPPDRRRAAIAGRRGLAISNSV